MPVHVSSHYHACFRGNHVHKTSIALHHWGGIWSAENANWDTVSSSHVGKLYTLSGAIMLHDCVSLDQISVKLEDTGRRLKCCSKCAVDSSWRQEGFLTYKFWVVWRDGLNYKRLGIPGWRSGLAPAFGPGRDPGDPGSNPTSGSRCMEPASPSACVSASLPLSVTIINK